MPRGGPRPGAGRPKGSKSDSPRALGIDGRVAARAHAEKAMQTLVDLLTSPQHTVRATAAVAILDRAYGRPAQAVELSGKDGDAIEHRIVNDAERFTGAISSIIARQRAEEAARDTQH